MPNLGYIGAGGQAGGWQALADIIARRREEELLNEKKYQFEREQELQQQALTSRLEEQRLQREELEQYRKEQLGLREREISSLEASRKAQEEARAVDDAARAAAAFRTNQPLTLEGIKTAFTGKMGEFVQPGKIVGEPGHETMEAPTWGETQAAAEKRLALEERAREFTAREAQDLRQQEAQMANARAMQAFAAALPKVQGLPSTTAPGGYIGFQYNPNAPGFGLQPIPGMAEQGGVVGPAASKAFTAAKPVAAFIDSLDALEAVGEKHNWQGLGIKAGLEGTMARWGLTTPPPGLIEMQAAVNDVRSFIGHERYGAALTAGEKQILNQFVADSYTPGKITREMVRAVKEIELGVLARLQEGPFGALNRKGQETPNPAGAAPASGDLFGEDVLNQFGYGARKP